MFDSIREKISKVQDGISASFRGLTVGEPVIDGRVRADLDAGADLLASYQLNWHHMHNLSESNAVFAKKVDNEIGILRHTYKKNYQIMNTLLKEVNNIEKLVTATESVVNQIGDLRSSIENVEEKLIKLEDLIEDLELDSKKQTSNQTLDQYRLSKLSDLNAIKGELSENHALRIKQKEEQEEGEKKVMRHLYQCKFEQDLDLYKRTGSIQSPDNSNGETTGSKELNLEDVELGDSTADLEKLLNDE